MSHVLQSNFNNSLLTPKWDETDVLSKQQEDSLIARMKMFVHLRQDLERVSSLRSLPSVLRVDNKPYPPVCKMHLFVLKLSTATRVSYTWV